MKWLNCEKLRLVLVGVVAGIMLSATNAWGAGFQDDFNRPDGEVGNGWSTQIYGTIEVKIVDNEVLIAGRQPEWWWRSGIFRAVENATKFSFDFKADDNFNVHIYIRDTKTTDGAMEFWAPPGGLFSYGSRESDVWTGYTEIPGSEMIAGEYNTLLVEQEGADFTLTLNGKMVGTATNNIPFQANEVFICSDATPYSTGSLHIDNVKIADVPNYDFNGDGIVDSLDMCIIVNHWGEDYSLCDIGPKPFGDGIIDVQDLIVLSEHLFEDVNDPTLIAHWAFDETEGIYAADSAGENNAIVMGGATWQPSGGQIDGALELDGVSGCVIASPGLYPADGPFSIFAWVKDGAPGQVIVSQQINSDWLALDSEGNLMTELESSDQLAGPLVSDTTITDGQWHRIGLIWDGSTRTLCVDGIKVAEDTQPGLESSENGLYIGIGKDYDTGTFFSGLIDDVRIYNRAVHP